MSSISGWQDPICYQFSFFAITDERECEDMLDVYREFVREMMPCMSRWIELGGAMLSKIHRPMNGYLMNEIRDEESLRMYSENLSNFSAEMIDEIDIASVNLDLRPYDWEVNGKTGRSAYLQAIEVIQNIDRFGAKYAENDEMPF